MNFRHYCTGARWPRSTVATSGFTVWRWIPLLIVTSLLVVMPVSAGTAVALASRASQAWRKLPTIPVKMAHKVFILSVARTPRQQERGLMFIHSLPANKGMLFIFHRACKPTFWMKNTYIPLDLIYANSLGTIQEHYTMAANGNRHHLYPSHHAILYAIEVNAGTYKKLGLKRGDKIIFPPGYMKAKPASP